MDENVHSAQDVIDKMIPIREYVMMHPDIYFACKSLNYRTFAEKWDGNRPLSVQVNWDAIDNRLVPELVFDKPLIVIGDEVKELLNRKIEEERQAFADCSEEIEFNKLNYDPNKWNLLSLFSGCGGLDLEFELAGLKAVMGESVMEAASSDKEVFDKNINDNVFNTIYVNDIFDEARETYAQNAGKYIYMDKSDIRKIKEFPKADIVLGSFPCPGFSEAGPRLVDDKRNF